MGLVSKAEGYSTTFEEFERQKESEEPWWACGERGTGNRQVQLYLQKSFSQSSILYTDHVQS